MTYAIVTELEWDDSADETDRGWWYKLMGEGHSRLLVSGTLHAASSREEIIEALHRDVRADRITIELGAVPDDLTNDARGAKAAFSTARRLKISVTGSRAIAAARQGAQLYVLNPQKGWIPAGPGALARADRMPDHALWIYGVAEHGATGSGQ